MGKCYSCARCSQSGKGGISLPLRPFRPKEDKPTVLPRPPSVDNDISLDKEEAVLHVESSDFRVTENAQRHHTAHYACVLREESPGLVVRRGSPFALHLTLSRAYDKDKDGICLVFTAKDAKNPSYGQGTQILCPVVVSETPLPTDGWQVQILSQTEEKLSIQVTPTPSCIVGEWTLEVDTKLLKKKDNLEKTLRYTSKQSIFILFNPWCEDDSVFLNEEEQRAEYVLNEGGLIYRGTDNRLRPCVWNFGQFQKDILECSCYLLGHIAKMPIVARADPVKVVRHISAAVNSPDDEGVLMGRWTDDYSGGKPPTSWAGSVAILQQFHANHKPVKFGQCWVFSGVVTTVCRALGIPCRSVTNFASAHDTQSSLTIDYVYDDKGDPYEKLNKDSVWNFHVWNEAWMRRPDLEPGDYGGWQAVDATPQEASDGLYRCGPCSVKAIKRGEIAKGFDGPFVFAEVNADKVYWRYQGKNRALKLINTRTDAIGKHISTKAVGAYRRESITDDYKFSEDTKEEREVMLRALRQCGSSFSRYYLNDGLEDVRFDVRLLDDVVIGQPFTVKVMITNKGMEKKAYTIKGVLAVHTVTYTGRLKNAVKKVPFEVTLDEGTEREVSLEVAYGEYAKRLVDQAAFNALCAAEVLETGFDYFAQDDFRVRKPDIKIEVEGEHMVDEEITVKAQLKNPLPRHLKNGRFVIEGPGLCEPLKLKVKGDVAPDATAEVTCKLRPSTSGEKSIAAKFYSKELDDVDGFKVIQVTSRSPKPAENTENAINGSTN